MEKKRSYDLSASTLHILAMLFMLCDHIWATVALGDGSLWLTALGRLAFPIFAFMITEGYCHTRNLRRYVYRLLIFAAISEIPFNLMASGSVFYPFHQNVIWTFLLGIALIRLNDLCREKKLWLRALVLIGTLVGAYVFGFLTFVDYYGAGVLTVLIFYLFRGRRWWCFLGQFLALLWINTELLGGLIHYVTLFGREFGIPLQALALLALIPIWLYRGRQGIRSRGFQYFRYAFYPAHMLILALIMIFL